MADRRDYFRQDPAGIVKTWREPTAEELARARQEIALGADETEVARALVLKVQADCDAFNKRVGSYELSLKLRREAIAEAQAAAQ